jgi:hypothetical protein
MASFLREAIFFIRHIPRALEIPRFLFSGLLGRGQNIDHTALFIGLKADIQIKGVQQ